MSQRHYQMCIGGQWCGAASGATREVMNPARGEAFATMAWGDRADARRAIEAAEAARRDWASVPLFQRAEVCEAMAERITRRRDELADILCTELGKPRHRDAVGEAKLAPHFFRQAAQIARYLEAPTQLAGDANKRMTSFRRPRGVVGVITPWNFPAAIPSEYLPYALVMGNTVAWTPAPTAAATATVLMDCVLETLREANLPLGAVNLVIGPGAEVGDEIVVNPGTHAIGMTGSAATGRIISQRAGLKPRLMELGGNGPAVVLPDADPVKAGRALGRACFANAGQVCSCAERILVADNLKQPLVDALVAEAGECVQGDVWSEQVNLGPQNNMAVVEKMTAHVDDAKSHGATVIVGGGRPELPGFFYEPTVLTDFTPDSLVNREETFGPIAPVRAFSSDDDAWQCIEACDLGLVSAVFTENASKAWQWAERLRTGIVVINDKTTYWEPHIPFGGMAGNASGIGRLGGRHTLEFMSDLQTIAWDIGEA